MGEMDLDVVKPPEPPKTRVPLKIEEALAGMAIGILGLITFANVVVRYLTNFSFAFTEEFSIILMVIMALLGASSAVAKSGHIRIAYFVDLLRPRPRRIALICGTTAVILTFFLLTLLGVKLTWDEYRFEVTSPGMGLPQWTYTIWLPLLSLAIMGRAIGVTIRLWREGRR